MTDLPSESIALGEDDAGGEDTHGTTDRSTVGGVKHPCLLTR